MLELSDRYRFVVATRETRESFMQRTSLGQSLKYFLYRNKADILIFPENKRGLPVVYNEAINVTDSDVTLIFIHDDVYMMDFYWEKHLFSALLNFDLVGLAGNIRRLPYQPSWAFKNTQFEWDDSINLVGRVGHGKSSQLINLSVYGNQTKQKVKLLDGLFLSCKCSTLKDNHIYFDEGFDYHFYDLDLCRQFEERNLTAGVVDISVMHESGGSFGSSSWIKGYQKYLDKWKS